MANARRLGRDDVYRAALRQLCRVEGLNIDDPLASDFAIVMRALEEALSREAGKATQSDTPKTRACWRSQDHCRPGTYTKAIVGLSQTRGIRDDRYVGRSVDLEVSKGVRAGRDRGGVEATKGIFCSSLWIVAVLRNDTCAGPKPADGAQRREGRARAVFANLGRTALSVCSSLNFPTRTGPQGSSRRGRKAAVAGRDPAVPSSPTLMPPVGHWALRGNRLQVPSSCHGGCFAVMNGTQQIARRNAIAGQTRFDASPSQGVFECVVCNARRRPEQ